MSTLTIELPEKVVAELQSRQVPDDLIQQVLIRSLELWLRVGYRVDSIADNVTTPEGFASPFQEDATSFVDQLLDDNLELFEKLAKY